MELSVTCRVRWGRTGSRLLSKPHSTDSAVGVNSLVNGAATGPEGLSRDAVNGVAQALVRWSLCRAVKGVINIDS